MPSVLTETDKSIRFHSDLKTAILDGSGKPYRIISQAFAAVSMRAEILDVILHDLRQAFTARPVMKILGIIRYEEETRPAGCSACFASNFFLRFFGSLLLCCQRCCSVYWP